MTQLLASLWLWFLELPTQTLVIYSLLKEDKDSILAFWFTKLLIQLGFLSSFMNLFLCFKLKGFV